MCAILAAVTVKTTTFVQTFIRTGLNGQGQQIVLCPAGLHSAPVEFMRIFILPLVSGENRFNGENRFSVFAYFDPKTSYRDPEGKFREKNSKILIFYDYVDYDLKTRKYGVM